MYNWFECKIKYEKSMENGLLKKVTEPYLVDAINFTEAEKRMIEEMAPFMHGEFQVDDIKRVKIAELFESSKQEDDKWYKCKLSFIIIDEKSGKEKKATNLVLVKAINIKTALANLEEGMKTTQIDYEVTAIQETPIMDVFHYRIPTKPNYILKPAA